MKKKLILLILLVAVFTAPAQENVSFNQASKSVQQKLEKSIEQLNALREQVAEEKVPLSRKLNNLESKLTEVRQEYQKTTRLLDSRTLDLSNLRSEIKSREQEATYLSNLLSEYIRNFESRLHISELQLYQEPLEKAKLAMDNNGLAQKDIYKAQTNLISVSMDRLFELLGGQTFTGSAVDAEGIVRNGVFMMVGPSVVFKSDDGNAVGTVEQKLGSLEPAVLPFGNPEDTKATSNLIENGRGTLPFDPTLGNAHKIEETKETIIGHIKKGGPVMYPIFIMAGAALLVALYKWICMILTIRKPSKRKINKLLHAVEKHDQKQAKAVAGGVRGPIGTMLKAATDHLNEPRELIEEVMYEKVLSTRLKLERFLPFIAISAASAPLLGLLGTVTGIINTFKLITVFGSGDVKTLSGGISEALITTEFGLIVAIPSLLLHAFLSRKAKGAVNEMEKIAVSFINQISKTPFYKEKSGTNLDQKQIEKLIETINQQKNTNFNNLSASKNQYPQDCAGGFMNTRVLSVDKAATVEETINFIRSVEIPEDIDTIFVVDGNGKYVGNIRVQQLLKHPLNEAVDSFADRNPNYIRVDTHKEEVNNIFNKHDFTSVPVVDNDGQLVGRVTRKRNGDGYGY